MSKKVTLTFKRKEIEFEVREAAYIIARARAAKSEAPEHDDNWLMDVFQASGEGQGGDEIPTRVMNLAFRECEHMLKNWTGVPVADESTLDDTFGAPMEYNMYMLVEDDTVKTTIQLLKNLIHAFICKDILYEWCLLVAPDLAQLLAPQVEELKKKIKDCLTSSSGERDLFPYPLW